MMFDTDGETVPQFVINLTLEFGNDEIYRDDPFCRQVDRKLFREMVIVISEQPPPGVGYFERRSKLTLSAGA